MSPRVGRNLSSIRCLKSSIVCWVMAALLEYRRMVAYIATSCRRFVPGTTLTGGRRPTNVEKAKTGRAGPCSAGFAIGSTAHSGDQYIVRAASWLLRDYPQYNGSRACQPD